MAQGRLFTIGHGSHSPATLVEQLTRAEVGYVVDVRSAPYSRYQPELCRAPLEQLLRDHGIRYVFMGDLLGGRPKDDDCYTNGQVDYAKIRTKDFFRRGMARLTKAYEQGLSVCLLCGEGQPSRCHRTLLIGAALADDGIPVTHLLPDGSRRTQEQVIAEVTKGQQSLFAGAPGGTPGDPRA